MRVCIEILTNKNSQTLYLCVQRDDWLSPWSSFDTGRQLPCHSGVERTSLTDILFHLAFSLCSIIRLLSTHLFFFFLIPDHLCACPF